MRTSLVSAYFMFMLFFAFSVHATNHSFVILEIQNMTLDKKVVSFELYIDGPDDEFGALLNSRVSNANDTEFYSLAINPTEYGVNTINFTLLYPGNYTFDFELTDGLEFDTETADATIYNNAPALNLIGGKQVLEGGAIEFMMDASDYDNDPLTYITNSSFGDLNPATGHFIWETKYNESGIYFVRFYATDGIESAAEIIMVNVTEFGNHAPELDLIGGKQVLEGQMLSFQINAQDVDHDGVFYSTNSSFGTLNAYSGDYSWLPGYADSGIYFMKFSATDGMEISSEIIMVNITESGNHAPILNPIGNRQVLEGNRLEFTVTAYDDDNDHVSFLTNATYGAINQDTGLFAFEPGSDDSGTYVVEFSATDGAASSSETITIEVENNEELSQAQNIGTISTFGSASNGRNIPLAQQKINEPVVTGGKIEAKDDQDIQPESITQVQEFFAPVEFEPADLITANAIRNLQMASPNAMEIITTLLVLVIAGSGAYLAFFGLKRKSARPN